MIDAAALSGSESAQIVSRVRVIDFDRVVILSTDPTDEVPLLAVISGSVTEDDTAEIKGSALIVLSLDKEHENLVPVGPGDPLSPISEVMVEIWLGARNPITGDNDLELQGTYEITETSIVEDGDGLRVTMDLEDKHRKIQRAKFYTPKVLSSRTTFSTAFTTLLESVIPESQLFITPTPDDHLTPQFVSFDIEDDRLSALIEMQVAIGYMMRFDGLGNVQIHPDTDPEDDPIWSFAQGTLTQIETISGFAKVVRTSRTLSDKETYNGVIVRGEPTGDNKPPVKASAWDKNPNSLTYFDPAKPDESRYGPVPFFHTSQFITTSKQANTAAVAMLPKKAGVVERVEVTTLLNARVRCGHVVQIERQRIGASGSFIVEAVTKPVKAGTMVVRLRERRLFEL